MLIGCFDRYIIAIAKFHQVRMIDRFFRVIAAKQALAFKHP